MSLAASITHPEKVLFPEDRITKGELAEYYERVAAVMLPHVRNRPVTMERFPAGIGAQGFMQKNVARGFPEWLQRIEVPKKGGVVNYPLITDEASLLWMVNQNCITPHVWTSRLPDLDRPDLCVFDLDPSVKDGDAVRVAALRVRDILAELGLRSWVKTSGSKGYHVVVPLDGSAAFDEVFEFGFDAGRLLVQRDPVSLTQEFLKVDRGDRIFVDTGRNGMGATLAAPYAVRPNPGAPVSTPCDWQEIESGKALPRAFRLRDLAARLDSIGDPWAEIADHAYSLTAARQRLGELLGPNAAPPHQVIQDRFGRRLPSRKSSPKSRDSA